jgi:LacI family transcriptional regulator
MNKIYTVQLLIETSREYGRALLRGIYRYHSQDSKWQIEQQTPFYVPSDRAETPLNKCAGHVDGVIMRDRKGSLDLLKRRIPVVFVGCLHENAPGVCRITTDDEAIAQLAAAHLLERGFRHFAFVGYDGMPWSKRRRDSFVEAVRHAGHECLPFVQLRSRAGRTWSQEQKQLALWLRALPKPVGLLACNDDRARHVIDVCRTLGLNVPEEIAVVGVDNDEFVCNLSNPAVSSVALGVEEAGYRAAQLLDRLMTGGKPGPQTIVPATLGVAARRSTEAMVIEDTLVAQAVRFILARCGPAHASGRRSKGSPNMWPSRPRLGSITAGGGGATGDPKPVRVPDVLREVGLTRRELYARFQRGLGCGVHEYIKKTRVAQIERLLLDTDCTVVEIAKMLGFPDADHIASYFRSVRGVNPQSLRSSRRSAL